MKSIQAKFRRQTFSVAQYWNLSYTERYSDGSEKDYRVFIHAKSFASAKEILLKRLREDDPKVQVKAVQGFMFHKKYKGKSNVRLRVQEWEQIRAAAFPNINNVLHKHYVPRPEWKSNRFNATDYDHIKTIGFKQGEENWSVKHRKGKILPLEARATKIYKGKWIEWDKAERDRTRKRLIHALVKHGGNRSNAAKFLGISRNSLYDLMQKFPEISWGVEYPPPKPKYPVLSQKRKSQNASKAMATRMDEGFKPFVLTAAQEEQRIANIRKTVEKKRQLRLKEFIPVAKRALKANNNSRQKAADSIGISRSYFSKMLRQTKDQVDWAKAFPSS